MKLNQLTKQAGFTLVEVLTVMLVLVAIASVTIEVSSDLAFQSRYEVTKDRYEKIKRAIIGRPDVLINGQPDISGFVADMGRLPLNIHDLLEEYYCLTNRSLTNQADCEAETDGVWRAQTSASTSNGLNYGWNGPYLTIAKDPLLANAFPDGWGRTAQGYCSTSTTTDPNNCPDNFQTDWVTETNDHNYGWYFNINSSGSFDSLEIISYGKDQILGGTSPYDVDYPNTLTMLDINDWIVEISSGISVSFKKPQTPAINLPPVSFCNNPLYSNRTNCETNSGVWFGGCDIQGHANKSSCQNASSTWHSCSNLTSTDKTACEATGAIWYGEGFGCSNGTSTNKSACITASSTWRSCSDNGTINNQAQCENNNHNWYGDSITHFGCIKRNYTNKTSCEDASQGNSTWYQCSNNAITNQTDCEQSGAYWMGYGYGCSLQNYSTQNACETNSGIWYESWGRCKNLTAPSTEISTPYFFTRNNDTQCGSSGTWLHAKKKLCMKIFYRRESDSTIDFITSDSDSSDVDLDPITIVEDGTNQTIKFLNFREDSTNTIISGLPIGINAIGVYEHDGSSCTDILYPSTRSDTVQLLFAPKTTFSIIDW